VRRDLAILAVAALVAAVVVVVIVRSRDDDEPSAVAKVESAIGSSFHDVSSARCRALDTRRFRCRVVREDRRVDSCRAETDPEGDLKALNCRPAREAGAAP
jgi:hypothetical protein